MSLLQNNPRCAVFAIKLIIPKNIFLLCMILLSSAVFADEPIHIGSATAVANDVFTSTATGETRIKINDALFFKQQVMTKDDSTLTITFRDSSTFSVSPQSVVVLDEFVFNPSENVLEKSINILKGSFRYISGFPIKNSITKIITPFGTAGIRGSAVQGIVGPTTGFTVNVGSGVMDFETKDGRKLTVQEGETLSLSAMCDTLPTPPSSVANSMQYLASIFAKTPEPVLTPQQILANAAANNIPVVLQKEAYIAARGLPIKPPTLRSADFKLPDMGTKGDPQVMIEMLIQELQNKNHIQVDSAARDIVAEIVASGLATDKITQVAINGVLSAKDDHKVDIAASILNTLQTLMPALAEELAPKIQQALSADQQMELPPLVPNIRFPFSAPVNKTKSFIR